MEFKPLHNYVGACVILSLIKRHFMTELHQNPNKQQKQTRRVFGYKGHIGINAPPLP